MLIGADKIFFSVSSPGLLALQGGKSVLKKPLFLLLVFLFMAASLLPLEVVAADVPTVVIPSCDTGDQFDRDFADDFADDFAEEGCFDEILISDPIEGFNRKVFWVNDKLYFYLFKPTARGYRLILPRPARTSLANAASNLATPVRAINALLQLKFRDVGIELYRFIVNTTVGLGGLFDPAGAATGLEKVDEDFGQTLGYYGVGHGFYLVLPVLGPSSFRDATGRVADSFADPLKYTDLPDVEYYGIKAWIAVNRLSLDPDTYEGIVRDSLDPYLFVRAAYSQRRAAQVGKVDYDILSVIGSFNDDEDADDADSLDLLGL